MTRRILTPPMCMGERMSGDPNRWFLKLPQLGMKIVVEPLGEKASWRIFPLGQLISTAFGESSGVRAAAKAAERHLCQYARLTLKLASRKP